VRRYPEGVTESDDREPVSLAPLTPEEALRALLAVKPREGATESRKRDERQEQDDEEADT
jgi:hypothetical protein